MQVQSSEFTKVSKYESAFRVFGIPIYSYELYENGTTMGTAENCVRIAEELGICAEEATANDIMTRGETIQLLYLLGTQEYQVSDPPIMSELDIRNPDGMDINKFLLELEEIPQEIRDKYQASGWKYIIDCEAIAQYTQELNVNCIGVCDYGKRAVPQSTNSDTSSTAPLDFLHLSTPYTKRSLKMHLFYFESIR